MPLALANKIWVNQILPVVNAYMMWHNLDDHATLTGITPGFEYSVVKGKANWEWWQVWHFNFAGSTHVFRGLRAHEECNMFEIEFGEEITTFTEGQEIVGRFITELYEQIKAWAINNNVPPENMVY